MERGSLTLSPQIIRPEGPVQHDDLFFRGSF